MCSRFPSARPENGNSAGKIERVGGTGGGAWLDREPIKQFEPRSAKQTRRARLNERVSYKSAGVRLPQTPWLSCCLIPLPDTSVCRDGINMFEYPRYVICVEGGVGGQGRVAFHSCPRNAGKQTAATKKGFHRVEWKNGVAQRGKQRGIEIACDQGKAKLGHPRLGERRSRALA